VNDRKLALQPHFGVRMKQFSIRCYHASATLVLSAAVALQAEPIPAHYSRLLRARFKGHDEKALADLACMMRDDGRHGRNRGDRERGGDLPVSGYVYFGQFIDHDITRDELKPDDPVVPPEERVNHRTPYLDLDSLYGNGPADHSKHLYEGPDDRAQFRLGMTQAARRGDTNEELPPTLDDLPRTNGITDLGDDRNDENLILAQLHVAFLQFHNRVLECFLEDRIPDPERYGETPFERARRFVTWHYQYIVVHDFLQKLILKAVWEKRDDRSWRLFKPNLGRDVALPVEFTQAAFRFGHSMVQNEYSLQGRGRIPLTDLLLKTEPGTPSPVLTADKVIDWELFVRDISRANRADNIDTLIADAMYHLPPASLAVFWAKRPLTVDMPLPAITLLRGSRIGLPSGQELCAAYKIEPLREDKIAFNQKAYDLFKEHDMLARTPLWYYVLREAEILGVHKSHGGECLGPVGSCIILDVLLGILEADPESYLAKSPNWTPPGFSASESGKKWRIDSLSRLVMFAKTKT
jgi:hypothetical protein